MARFARSQTGLAATARLGDGWRAIVAQLNAELGRLDPPAEAAAVIDGTGLLSVSVFDPARRPETMGAALAAERLAARRCELCCQAGSLRAGAVLRVVCDDCESLMLS